MRIILADDHVMFRRGLKSLLLQREGYEVVMEASDGHEAVEAAEEHEADLAILDFGMPMLNGIDAARDIHARSPKTRVILLTMIQDNEHVLAALTAGIRGCILKSQAAAELMEAAEAVVGGSVYLSPLVAQMLANAYTSSGDAMERLSDRERQVLRLALGEALSGD